MLLSSYCAGAVHDILERVGNPTQLALEQREGQRVESATAKFGGDIGGEQPLFDRTLDDLLEEIIRNPIQFFDNVFVGQEFPTNESPGALDDHALLFCR